MKAVRCSYCFRSGKGGWCRYDGDSCPLSSAADEKSALSPVESPSPGSIQFVDAGSPMTVVPYEPVWACEKCGKVHKGLWPEDGCDWCQGDKIAERMKLRQ